MAKTGFYCENAYRQYPFVQRSATPLPYSAIVDFGAIMGLDAEFDESLHQVYLYEIRRTIDTFRFEFRTTAPAATAYALVFHRDLADPENAIEHAETNVLAVPPRDPESSSSESSSSASLPVDEHSCPHESVWEGFLVTGSLTDLATLLADGEILTFYDGLQVVEPARIQSLSQSFIRGVSLGNIDRVRVRLPEQCLGGGFSPFNPQVLPGTKCLVGDLKFMEGYNTAIRQEDNTNTIVIGGAVGAGAGTTCDEVPLHPDEVPPFDSTLLTGGPRCDEILKTINGVGGQLLRLFGGSGVRVYPHPEELATIVVDFDLHDFATCLADLASISLSSSSEAPV